VDQNVAIDPQETSEMRSDGRPNAAATVALATEAKRTTEIVVA
jgi:fructose-1,6-bisphosphatase/sedoheptulose 1,7-bisphosphatase-like protein